MRPDFRRPIVVRPRWRWGCQSLPGSPRRASHGSTPSSGPRTTCRCGRSVAVKEVKPATAWSEDHILPGQHVRLAPAAEFHHACARGKLGHLIHQRLEVDRQAWIEVIQFLPSRLPHLLIVAAQIIEQLLALVGFECERLQLCPQVGHGSIGVLVELDDRAGGGGVVSIKVGPPPVEHLLRLGGLF
jgi:hypothetical protein